MDDEFPVALAALDRSAYDCFVVLKRDFAVRAAKMMHVGRSFCVSVLVAWQSCWT